jgi:hypothetical protein
MTHVATPHTRESLLQDFVDWAGQHIKGDENGEAQNTPTFRHAHDCD